jgi:hypothetical protein
MIETPDGAERSSNRTPFEGKLLRLADLADFTRQLGGTEVLTTYVDARVTDPAMRDSWRPALRSALRRVRSGISGEHRVESFDRAAAFLETPGLPLGGIWGSPGWVAFLTDHGPQYVADLPARVPTLAVWREGPFVSPYVRALKQHRPVIVMLVDSESVQFYRYATRALTRLSDLTLSTIDESGPLRPRPPRKRRIGRPGPRLATGTDRLQRRRRAFFQRLIPLIRERLLELAGDDGWILVGGTPEWAGRAGQSLPVQLGGRALVSPALAVDDVETRIAREAERAARRLRSELNGRLLDEVLEQAGALGRGAAGVPDTQRALRTNAIDLLLLSPGFLRRDPDLAEEAARAALLQGAEIEVLSGSAAAYLDRTADGIAARLRFATDAVTPQGTRPSEVPG